MDNDRKLTFTRNPAMYELRGAKGTSLRIHPSRVIPFRGQPHNEGAVTVSSLDQFWGDPLLQSIKGAIDNSESTRRRPSRPCCEMKQDVINIPGLTEQIATGGPKGGLRRESRRLTGSVPCLMRCCSTGATTRARAARNGKPAELSFTQHPELLRQFLSIVAGAADIPVTRLMGESPGRPAVDGQGRTRRFQPHDFGPTRGGTFACLSVCSTVLIRSAARVARPRDNVRVQIAVRTRRNGGKRKRQARRRDGANLRVDRAYPQRRARQIHFSATAILIESGRWPGLDQRYRTRKSSWGFAPGGPIRAATRPKRAIRRTDYRGDGH